MEEMNDLTFSGLLLMAMNMLYMKKTLFFLSLFSYPAFILSSNEYKNSRIII